MTQDSLDADIRKCQRKVKLIDKRLKRKALTDSEIWQLSNQKNYLNIEIIFASNINIIKKIDKLKGLIP